MIITLNSLLVRLPIFTSLVGFPGGTDSKESTCSVGDLGLIPELGRSIGGGHGNPLQYYFPENPHGQRSLVGYNPWGSKESGMTERLSTRTSPLHLILILKLHILLYLRACSSVTSFSLIYFLNLYILVRLVTFPKLGEVAFCRRCPMCLRSALLWSPEICPLEVPCGLHGSIYCDG